MALAKVEACAARAGVFSYRALVWDSGGKLPTKTKFDGVLVDAPCSGVGTWHRNPHARWTTTLRDVQELSEVQNQLLATAAASVKPGGKLIYAVCTLTHKETEEVANSFEKRFPDFQQLAVTDPFRSGEHASRIWLWPQATSGNGMFVAAWRKSSPRIS